MVMSSESFLEGVPLSETVKRISWWSPACVKSGFQVNVRDAGLKLAPIGRLITEYVKASPSGSSALMENSKRAPSFTVL